MNQGFYPRYRTVNGGLPRAFVVLLTSFFFFRGGGGETASKKGNNPEEKPVAHDAAYFHIVFALSLERN